MEIESGVSFQDNLYVAWNPK